MTTPWTARSYMSTELVTFSPDMDVMQAVHLLIRHSVSGAPVVDEHGNLVGMLSERDCLQAALTASYHSEWGGRVSEFMHEDVQTVDAGTSITVVAEMFIRGRYRRYPVLDGNRLVGQISRRDILHAFEALTQPQPPQTE